MRPIIGNLLELHFFSTKKCQWGRYHSQRPSGI